jgi:hypothetical protein
LLVGVKISVSYPRSPLLNVIKCPDFWF